MEWTCATRGRSPGAGPEESGLRRDMPDGRTTFLGPVAGGELSALLYERIDALIVPSAWETGPLVAWEAMAAGVPVVASRYLGSGLEEALRNEENALLFDPGDVEAAARQLARLAREPGLADQLAAGGKELLRQRYSRVRSIEAWERAIEAILTLRPLPPAARPRVPPATGRLERWAGPGSRRDHPATARPDRPRCRLGRRVAPRVRAGARAGRVLPPRRGDGPDRGRTRVLAPVKLAAGQAWSAWRAYPAMRRALLAGSPGPPILVTGVYRSGTTWAGAMLAPAGLWHLHEPFNPNRGLSGDELPYAEAGTARPEIDRLVARLLGGGHRETLRLPKSGRWFMPLRLLPIKPRRVLIKDPSAALLSEYLVRRHGMRALILFRHPAAVVGSFLRLGWPTGSLVQKLLASPALVNGPLKHMGDAMEDAAGRKDALSGTVFCACVARALWDFSERNPRIDDSRILRRALPRPDRRIPRLFERLDLAYDDEVRRVHVRLTAGRRTTRTASTESCGRAPGSRSGGGVGFRPPTSR